MTFDNLTNPIQIALCQINVGFVRSQLTLPPIYIAIGTRIKLFRLVGNPRHVQPLTLVGIGGSVPFVLRDTAAIRHGSAG